MISRLPSASNCYQRGRPVSWFVPKLLLVVGYKYADSCWHQASDSWRLTGAIIPAT